jgi:hypothetical protein
MSVTYSQIIWKKVCVYVCTYVLYMEGGDEAEERELHRENSINKYKANVTIRIDEYG